MLSVQPPPAWHATQQTQARLASPPPSTQVELTAGLCLAYPPCWKGSGNSLQCKPAGGNGRFHLVCFHSLPDRCHGLLGANIWKPLFQTFFSVCLFFICLFELFQAGEEIRTLFLHLPLLPWKMGFVMCCHGFCEPGSLSGHNDQSPY